MTYRSLIELDVTKNRHFMTLMIYLHCTHQPCIVADVRFVTEWACLFQCVARYQCSIPLKLRIVGVPLRHTSALRHGPVMTSKLWCTSLPSYHNNEPYRNLLLSVHIREYTVCAFQRARRKPCLPGQLLAVFTQWARKR